MLEQNEIWVAYAGSVVDDVFLYRGDVLHWLDILKSDGELDDAEIEDSDNSIGCDKYHAFRYVESEDGLAFEHPLRDLYRIEDM